MQKLSTEGPLLRKLHARQKFHTEIAIHFTDLNLATRKRERSIVVLPKMDYGSDQEVWGHISTTPENKKWCRSSEEHRILHISHLSASVLSPCQSKFNGDRDLTLHRPVVRWHGFRHNFAATRKTSRIGQSATARSSLISAVSETTLNTCAKLVTKIDSGRQTN